MSENNKNGFEDLGKTISDLLTNVTKVVTESTEDPGVTLIGRKERSYF